ncbi:MAG: AraC family ligand binding domain-containing protein [Eubacterium sp.]|nr:AraC family ligand binding domain-containing protein [Eubacterium sp.]
MIIPCNLPNTPLFGTQNSPLLLYVHQIGAEEFNAKNLLAHKHDNFELMLCLNGTSTFLIDGKTYPVRKNDLIVYNRGVLHDEHAQQSYLDILCFGARGIRMPGRSPDAVTGPGTSPIIHCGRYSAYIRHLFQSMVTYRQIIYCHGVPFSLTVPPVPKTLDVMTRSELDQKLQHSYEQSLAGEGRPFADVFDDLERSLT